MSAILVSWAKILNAALYKVFRSTSETGTFAVVDTVTSNTYYDTGLVPGSVFYYKVSAMNGLGESGQSPAMLATTAVPGKVSARFVSPASIVVTWTLVTGATSYNVYRDTTDTGTFSFSRTVVTDTLVDSGLAAGTRYYYRIRATNNSGESGLSFVKNTITIPATPAGANAAAFSSSGIIIAWPAVTGAASYKIYRNTVDTGAFRLAGSAAKDTFSDTSKSLSAATTYYYKISAVNSSGESGLSASCTTITRPQTPYTMSAVAVSSSSMVITWPAVAGAATYNIYRSTIDTGAFPLAGSAATDTFSDTGLVAGASYYYKISAVNSSGESGLSAAFTAITLPGMPVGVNAAAGSSSSIVITWPAVTGAASYNVYRSDVDTGTYSAIGSVATDTFSDTGLAAGATYYYRISGLNNSGESEQSAPVSATTLLTGFVPFLRPLEMLAFEMFN